MRKGVETQKNEETGRTTAQRQLAVIQLIIPNCGSAACLYRPIMEEGCSTLVRSLEQKYLDDDDDIVQDILFTGFVSFCVPYFLSMIESNVDYYEIQTGCSPCKMASQRALELLVLNNMNIGTIGDTDKFATLASHVSEVGKLVLLSNSFLPSVH